MILSDEAVIRNYGLVTPMSMVRINRLLLFARLCHKSPPIVVSLLKSIIPHNFGWIKELRSDLFWLHLSGKLPFDHHDLLAAMSCAGSSNMFANLVRSFGSSAAANVDIPSNFPSLRSPISSPQRCPDCQVVFMSVQKLSVHRNRKHGFVDPINCHISGTVCTVCMLDFHTRTRVLNHLKYRSQMCLSNILIQGPCMSMDAARTLDIEEREFKRELYAKGLRAHTALIPVCRMCGPIPAPDNFGSPHFLTTSKCHVLGFGRNHHY